jgi:UDP-N-acetyl-2-amino-2-deoxyglucuronate dehydrogenase
MADKKFNVGVIGYGWAAGAHIEAINRGALGQVTAIMSSRPLDPAELEKTHGSPISVHTSLESLLADKNIHVVDVTGYPWEHADAVVAAARAGKHIILEKPAALSLSDLRRIEHAVTQAGVQLCICLECRYASQFQGIRSIIERGLLGSIHYGEVDYYHGVGPWYGQYRWNIKKSGGGSSLLSAGCHALDALLLCLGGEVDEVTSYHTRSQAADFAPYEYPTTSITIVKMTDGRLGKCTASIDCLQPYYFHTHLIGSEGSLLDDKVHFHGLAGMNKNRWSQLSYGLVDSGNVHDHPYQTQFDAFFAALDRGEEMPLSNLRECVKTHEVIFAADLSAAEGRAVKLAEIKAIRS